MSAPTPTDLVGSLPLPQASFRAGRLRQVKRLEAERDRYPDKSAKWHEMNSRLVYAQRRLAELARPS